jgi:Asp-tRNA(Asn)/Glu-tRNA(Gln) amidotransferase A subunit family amidase
VTRTTLVQAVSAIETGDLTSAQLLTHYLKQIDQLEPTIHAFAWLDPDRARALADRADHAHPRDTTPLRGLPIGIKDIIDVAGVPTSCGTPALEDQIPTRSATAVERLERAGAISIGKTVTAELAFATPGPTTNPWNPRHTPGGSSMGSAAGVAAGFFPAALGTQTNSSTVMPAALCGVVGFKPSQGQIPVAGIMEFSPSLDQVGTFTASVADAALLCSVLTATPAQNWFAQPPVRRLRFVIARTAEWEGAAPAVKNRFDDDIDRLKDGGALIEEQALPSEFAQARATHRTIMAYEAARHVAPRFSQRRPELSAQLNRFLDEGETIKETDYRAALHRRQLLTSQFETWIRPYDAVLTPAAPDEAPTLESTGDPRFCTHWTLIGAPAIALPSGQGPHRLPLGLQLVGAQNKDRQLLATARFVERLFGHPLLEPSNEMT